MDLDQQLQSLIEMAYLEDGERDVTSELICPEDDVREAVILARQDGIVCGLPFIDKIMHHIDPELTFEPFLDEGEVIKQRMMIGALEGKSASLLRVERVLLNFLGRLCGVSSLTHSFVTEVKGTNAVILDTRKTIPGWRYLDKYAVSKGGGINHRMNATDAAMIKDNHVVVAGGVDAAIESFRAKDADTPLIVEVQNLKELDKVAALSKDIARVTLDNFSVEDMSKAVEMVGGKVLLEASGGVHLENVREIAETGVHFISIGSLTHSAPAFDFSFQLS